MARILYFHDRFAVMSVVVYLLRSNVVPEGGEGSRAGIPRLHG
jgi:hypothetical protein